MIQKPPTTSFASGNGPSVTFDLPALKVTRALIVAGGVSPSSASSTPAFPSSSLYLPILSMLLRSGTQPGFAFSYTFGNMIIMKRMVFSLKVERAPYQGRFSYIGAWTALGTECYGALGAGSVSTYASNGRDGNRQTAYCFFRVAKDSGNRAVSSRTVSRRRFRNWKQS